MYQYGSFGKRLLAFVIDWLLVFLIIIILTIFFRVLGFQQINAIRLILGLTFILYNTLFVWKRGSTIGKGVFKLKVLNSEYQKVSFGKALLRESVGKFISGILDLGYFWVLIDKKRQGFHDKIAKTFVVQVDQQGNLIPSSAESQITTGQKVAFWILFLFFGIPIVFIAIFTAIYLFVGSPVKIVGHSMDPNYLQGQFYMTDKTEYRTHDPQRGDVIIMKNPQNQTQEFIKRVIALPGDQIMIQNGQVYLNGQLLNEPYLQPGTKTDPERFLSDSTPLMVPQGEYFVMGDNRLASSDSRDWGFVTRAEIISKLSFCYWQCSASR